MCSTYSGGFTDKIDYSSMIKRGTSKNSSDLERGTVPRSIGDEFFEVPLLVIEIWHRQFCTFHKDDAHFGSPTVKSTTATEALSSALEDNQIQLREEKHKSSMNLQK